MMNDSINDDSFVVILSLDCPRLQASSFFCLSTPPPSPPEKEQSSLVSVEGHDTPG